MDIAIIKNQPQDFLSCHRQNNEKSLSVMDALFGRLPLREEKQIEVEDINSLEVSSNSM